MALITSETVSKIRKALKAKYPEIKFSIRKQDNTAIRVSILKSPHFTTGATHRVNHYWIDRDPQFNADQKAVLNGIVGIIRKEGDFYDNSEVQSDYEDIAFYYSISVGNDDQEHEYSV